jgi:uncharacterized membrane protein
MNYIKKYIEYLKDNSEGYWFKRKLYGWGWTPAKWQGLVVVLVAIGLIILNGLLLARVEHPATWMLVWFFVKIGIIVTVLLYICFKKGEKPRWQWGLPDKK